MLGIAELLLDRCAVTPDHARLQSLYHQSRVGLLRMLDDALLLPRSDAKVDSLFPQPVALAGALGAAAAERNLLTKALRALLETAVRCSNPQESVRASCQSGPSAA